jgi:hypothetical protein
MDDVDKAFEFLNDFPLTEAAPRKFIPMANPAIYQKELSFRDFAAKSFANPNCTYMCSVLTAPLLKQTYTEADSQQVWKR